MSKLQLAFKKAKRLFRYLVVFVLAVFACWICVILVGLIPANNRFAETEDGIEIFVVSNAVHADIVLPLGEPSHDLAEFFTDDYFPRSPINPTHVAIGWGDRGFFIDTPTWSDLKISTAAQALLWTSPTCLHVHMTDVSHYQNARSVKISRQQYRALVYYILSSFEVDDEGKFIPIFDASYGEADAFFQAKGAYHLFNTCNSWVGSGLRTAGVRTPIMTSLPGTPTLYFPNSDSK